MFLNKYLNDVYLNLIYDKYVESYINELDENNFNEIYLLLKNNNFYFINDVILNNLELFEFDKKYVELALNDIKSILGKDYASIIGKNLLLVNKIVNLAISYEEKDN